MFIYLFIYLRERERAGEGTERGDGDGPRSWLSWGAKGPLYWDVGRLWGRGVYLGCDPCETPLRRDAKQALVSSFCSLEISGNLERATAPQVGGAR